MGRPYSNLPPSSRPRERLLRAGREALSDGELLALQLRTGTGGRSASDLASELLAEFGSLDRLASASIAEITRVPGLGPAKAATLIAGFELAQRLAMEDRSTTRLTRASEVAALAQRALAGLRRERTLVFVCDRRGKLLHQIQLSQGTDRKSLLAVREVLSAVLSHDGSTFAVAHNHPSGDATPSRADAETTDALSIGAKAVGLKFLGHVVVAGDEWAEVPLRPSRRMPDSGRRA